MQTIHTERRDRSRLGKKIYIYIHIYVYAKKRERRRRQRRKAIAGSVGLD